LVEYSRKDANIFRNKLIERGLVRESVKRNFNVINAIFNLIKSEKGLEIVTPFSNMQFGSCKQGTERLPIPLNNLIEIQKECLRINDDVRWLVMFLSDTGMRLAEACGLSIEDLKLEGEYPHVIVKPHQWRRLKTHSSQRIIPLVGASLWGFTITCGYSPSSFKSSIERPQASASLMPVSLRNITNQRTSSFILKHSFCISIRLFNGIGSLSVPCLQDPNCILEKGVTISRPFSLFIKLKIAFITLKLRLTLSRTRPRSINLFLKMFASLREYSTKGLSPTTSTK
jgi:hypothetical protein